MFSMNKHKSQQDLAKYDRIHVIGGDQIAARLAELIANPPDASIKTLITPKMAEAMLSYNQSNRPMAVKTVSHYAAQMADGNWRYTRVPIIFSDAGRLIDGQHRLSAIVESQTSVWADVAFGAPDEAFAFVDIGKKRTAGDIFSINGIKNGKHIAAIALTVRRMVEAGSVTDGGNSRVGNAELYDFYLENRDIDDVMPVYRTIKKSRLATPSLMAGLYVIMARKCRRDAEKFFEIAFEGFGAAEKNHPALILRKQLIEAATSGAKLSPRTQAGLAITAWNRTRDGLSGRGLKFNPESKMPRVH